MSRLAGEVMGRLGNIICKDKRGNDKYGYREDKQAREGRNMRALLVTLGKMLQGFYQAVTRFPLTVICLFSSTALTCYMISLHRTPDLILQKLMFVFLLGAFIGVTAQFACERYRYRSGQRLAVYGLAIILTLLYYLSIASVSAIDYVVTARTMVAVFAMLCVYIWLPSSGGENDFDTVALVHFKSALTSFLYAAVLSVGLAVLLGAIDLLLFPVDRDAFGYMLAIVWISFATLSYLARLPHFHSYTGYMAEDGQFPSVLAILVSQIAIPLMFAYTLVLFSYFIKIGLSGAWPVGQLGPMILAYSAVGLLLFVLASCLSNRIAWLYKLIFPKVLIPIVGMQLMSVAIRLRAYGVTESRYYVALFGVFSLLIGLILTIRPQTKNGIIALLAAAFAIVSVVPPIDAFTISRNSQIQRLERMLQGAGVLVADQLQAKPDTDLQVRRETTNILQYLERRGYLAYVNWLPDDFSTYRDMQKVLGFEPAYGYTPELGEFFHISLNPQEPLAVAGYDVLLQAVSYRQQPEQVQDFRVGNADYRLLVRRLSPLETRVSVLNGRGEELVATGLQEFAMALKDGGLTVRETLSAQQLTLEAIGEQCRLRIVFQHINGNLGGSEGEGIDYNMYILVAVGP